MTVSRKFVFDDKKSTIMSLPTTAATSSTSTTNTISTSSNPTGTTSFTSIVSARHRTLMESLLARKIELAAGSLHPDRPLIRTDSLDSTSSLGSISSMVYGEDVCRCDDCLLGIADLYTIGPETATTKKKVNDVLAHREGRFSVCLGKSFCQLSAISIK